MKTLKVVKFVGFGLLWFGFITLAIFITMWLWNWLIPQLFHGPIITFWQTAGLIILSKILFSGITPGGGRHHEKKHWHDREPEWWRKYKDKFRNKANSSEVE